MDKNSLIGFGLLAALLIGYLAYNTNVQQKAEAERIKDSTTKAKLISPNALIDTTKAIAKDSIVKVNDSSTTTIVVPNTSSSIQNEDIVFVSNSHGANPVSIELKKFKTAKQKPLFVFHNQQNFLDFGFKNNTTGSFTHTKDIGFVPSVNGKSITYTSPNNDVKVTYTLPEKGYMIAVNVSCNGIDINQPTQLTWNATSPLSEYDATTESQYQQFCFNSPKEGYDYYTIRDSKKETFKDNMNWLSYKQHYFNTTLLSKTAEFTDVQINTNLLNDTTNDKLTSLNASAKTASNANMNFELYAGPNDYAILKSYNKNLEEIIPLGYGWLTFVKYINKWIIMPIFNLLAKFFSNYGIVILLLTLIIRLLMSPLTYGSYVSGAKMKALKPEIDELKKQYGDDQQQFGVKQMELYRTAGVNPLGGCLPALLQLPIFFALLQFFPSAIQLRQQPFLWSKDLSTFDSILNLGFNIPLYGDHVSLWTLLFVATSLILALYNVGMTQGNDSNPALKYLPFIMPIMFLGIFNKLPASLTFYYFVSNVITIVLQWVIQNFIIKEEKIRAKIEENKKKGPKENKMMQRFQEMQKQNMERMEKAKKK